jgi:hypothetical protein
VLRKKGYSLILFLGAYGKAQPIYIEECHEKGRTLSLLPVSYSSLSTRTERVEDDTLRL